MKEAADLGDFYAQVKLGSTYFLGVGGTVDKAKSAYYYTLALSQEPDFFRAHWLGFIFLEGSGGMKKSLYRAKYYIQRSAEKGLADAYTPLALILLELSRVQYDGKVISGYNCIPRALFWQRKVAEKGDPRAIKVVAEIEKLGQQGCVCCLRKAKCFPEPMKHCARCKAVWYCGRECQRKHRKDGHKIDCVQQF